MFDFDNDPVNQYVRVVPFVDVLTLFSQLALGVLGSIDKFAQFDIVNVCPLVFDIPVPLLVSNESPTYAFPKFQI